MAVIFLAFASCGSTEGKTDKRADGVDAAAAANKALNGVKNDSGYSFDPNTITKEEKELVRVDLDDFVRKLNVTIRQKKYNVWLAQLTPRYQAYLSSKENLQQASQADRLRTKNIVLKTLFDYFVNVVVPSRSNGRVDDIEFVTEGKVKAYMNINGQRLRLYELERVGDSWKVSN
jgi:hypothetical protein